MTGKSTCLVEDKWLTTPFMHTGKSPLDRISYCLLVLMKYLSWLEPTTEPVSKDVSIMKLFSFMSDLDEIWSQISHWESHRACHGDEYPPECVYTYTNAHQANTVATHGLARLILLLLLDRRPGSHLTLPVKVMGSEYKEGMMAQASASIISAAAYLSAFDIGCAYLRIILPLQFVAQHSPQLSRRWRARV